MSMTYVRIAFVLQADRAAHAFTISRGQVRRTNDLASAVGPLDGVSRSDARVVA
jgi:hypothetical protein